MADAPVLKMCRGCGTEKTVAEFSRDRTAADGLQSRCKDCRRAQSRIYYAENVDYWRERYAADPEAFAARRVARRERLREAGELSAVEAEYNRAQREARREAGTLADFDRARHNVRRAREIGAGDGPGTIPIDGKDCVYCGAPATCVDHVIPITRGGSNDECNLVPACTSCNSSKRDRLLSEWLPRRRRGAA